MTRPFLVLLALAAGCATTTAREAPPEPTVSDDARDRPEIARPPFSADEIRGATRPFRTYVWRVEASGRPPEVHRLRFVEVDDEGCRIERTLLDESGEARGEPSVRAATWEELVGHASYPREATTITDVEVEVPAGVFDAWRYQVIEEEGGVTRVTRAYFAKALPGAPVLHVVEEDGVEVSRMALLAHDPGGTKPRAPKAPR